jgi:hypothetical protein
MKITTDVGSAGLRPPGNVLPRTSANNRSMDVSDAKIAQDVIVKMQREKSLIDALAIAQSSRELVQKALNVSSRLLSLASEAMITGRVNMDEVSNQMSTISSSMAGYGESVAVPVEGTPVPVDDVRVKLDESFVRLKERGAQMLNGSRVAGEDFVPITADLNEIASKIDVKVNKYTAELGNVKRIEDYNFNYSGLNRSTADMIAGNSAGALEAQGNINYEMAAKLTMA